MYQVAEGEEGAGAVEKVKTLGSFLFSSIKGAGQKLKESVRIEYICYNLFCFSGGFK